MTDNSTTAMKVWLDVRENATGVVVRHPHQWIFGGDYVWSEGNFSCDCNRADFFIQGQLNDTRAEAGDVPCSDGRYSIRLTNGAGEVIYQDMENQHDQ